MIRNILAFFAGIIIGGAVNGALIAVSPYVIPLPAEGDIAVTMHLWEPKHFVFPFLAHALGTFVGALIAALIAASHKLTLAMAVGLFFLIGGITMVLMLPAPIWFNFLDLVAAYIPMAYLGAIVGGAKRL